MTSAAGYVRVSTDAQGERGYGLEVQRNAIDAEIQRRGWTLADIYTDVASGGSRRRRPQLDAALADLAAGKVDALVVSKLDRLSRSLLDFANLMAQSQREGWAIVALDIGVDTSTVNGELVASIIMALAQWERRIISQRTKDALGVVKSRGVALGRPVTVPTDVEGLIRTLRQSGIGYGTIAKTLNDARVPTAQGGARWYASTIRAIVTRNSEVRHAG